MQQMIGNGRIIQNFSDSRMTNKSIGNANVFCIEICYLNWQYYILMVSPICTELAIQSC